MTGIIYAKAMEVGSFANGHLIKGPLAAPFGNGAEGLSMEQDASAFVADRELIQTLEKRSQLVFCGEDLVLFRQGEAPNGLYILRSGEATLVMRSESGEEVMCLRVAASSLIGLPAIVGNKPYTLTATARQGAEVKFVTRVDYEDLIRAEPSLCFKLLEVLAAEVRAARNALLAI